MFINKLIQCLRLKRRKKMFVSKPTTTLQRSGPRKKFGFSIFPTIPKFQIFYFNSIDDMVDHMNIIATIYFRRWKNEARMSQT